MIQMFWLPLVNFPNRNLSNFNIKELPGDHRTFSGKMTYVGESAADPQFFFKVGSSRFQAQFSNFSCDFWSIFQKEMGSNKRTPGPTIYIICGCLDTGKPRMHWIQRVRSTKYSDVRTSMRQHGKWMVCVCVFLQDFIPTYTMHL